MARAIGFCAAVVAFFTFHQIASMMLKTASKLNPTAIGVLAAPRPMDEAADLGET